MIAGIVLAAGAGTRFGSAKQLADLDGLPLLEHALAAIAAAGLDRVVVVLGAEGELVLATVDLHGATPVLCRRWQEGQSVSLACGLARVEQAEAVVVTLGDQPQLSPEAVRRVVAARGEQPSVRATYGGTPGHPVLIERPLFPALRDAAGDVGARNVLRSAGTTEVACDDLGGGADVDTPDQLAALWRQEASR